MEPTAPTTWTAQAPAWIALAVSLVTLWYGVIRPWWRTRKASPGVRLDLLNFQTASGMKEEIRVVITDHGPADMREIDVQVFDADGALLAPGDVTALWPKMPVDYLHAGESLYLTLSPSIGTRDARGALIRWRDVRRGEQKRRVGLSYNRVV